MIFPARLVTLNLAVSEALAGQMLLLATPALTGLVRAQGAESVLTDLAGAATELQRDQTIACFPEMHATFPREYVDVVHGDEVHRYGLVEALLLLRYAPRLYLAELASPREGIRKRPRLHYRHISPPMEEPEGLQRSITLMLRSKWPESERFPMLAAGRMNTSAGRLEAIRTQLQLHASAIRLSGNTADGRLEQVFTALQRLRSLS